MSLFLLLLLLLVLLILAKERSGQVLEREPIGRIVSCRVGVDRCMRSLIPEYGSLPYHRVLFWEGGAGGGGQWDIEEPFFLWIGQRVHRFERDALAQFGQALFESAKPHSGDL